MELYRNELGTVFIALPTGSSSPTAQLIKDGNTTSLSGVEWNSTDHIVSVDLPFSLTSLDQEFDVKFNFTIGGESAQVIEHVKVVTPVLTRSKGDLIAPGKYNDFEPIVRHVIESFTGQSFGKWTGTYTIYGENDSELQLPSRLISLSALSFGGVPQLTDTYLIKGDRWFLAKNRYDGLTAKQAPPEESVEVVISGGQRIFYPFRGYARFGESVEYSVSGVWGYEYIPENVAKAAAVLFEDYVCPEATYRNRYVQDVAAQDWKLRFSGRTWDGTGNVIADQLLDKFKRSGMAII